MFDLCFLGNTFSAKVTGKEASCHDAVAGCPRIYDPVVERTSDTLLASVGACVCMRTYA